MTKNCLAIDLDTTKATDFELSRAGINLRRVRLVRAYVENNGNGTQAALKAGYAPGKDNDNARVQACRALTTANVQKLVADLMRDTVANITPEQIIGNLTEIRERAMEKDKFGDAIKCDELVGKYKGMWTNTPMDLGDGITFNVIRSAAIDAEYSQVEEEATHVKPPLLESSKDNL